MIDGLRGGAVLKDLATLAQNLQQKLGAPVSIEVLQKILESKDGYKYIANVDGKLAEIMSKQQLDSGVKYWADGVKNQTTNTLAVENLIQKPQILQNEIFKNEVLSNILGFDKLVEVVAQEFAETPKPTAKTTDNAPTPTSTPAPAKAPSADMNSKEVIRLAAADTDLVKTVQTTETQAKQPTQTQQEVKTALPQDTKPAATDPKQPKTDEQSPKQQTSQAQTKTAQETIVATKEAVIKELKEIATQATQKPTTLETKAEKQTEQPKESAKQPQQASANVKQEPKLEQKTDQKQEVRQDAPAQTTEKSKKEEIKEKLKDFKSIEASPVAPSKQEIEKAKSVRDEIKAQVLDTKAPTTDAAKAEVAERVATVLAQNFEMLPKSMLDDAVQKLSDLIFGKFTAEEADENIKKILEHLQKQVEQKAQKEAGKEAIKGDAKAEATEEVGAEGAKAEIDTVQEEHTSKTDNPASKLKAQILEELAKVGTKSDFGILSNVAMALNKEVFTFVLADKGVLQFRKKKQKELNAKTVEFYSAFETLGPVSGEITHIEGDSTSLSLNVEFESTYRMLKETLKELSFFDKANVSITHGIKEIVEIKSSFLDTIG